MNILKLKNISVRAIFALCAATTLFSCSDERFADPNYTVTGEDVTMSVSLKLPQMSVKTRAALDKQGLDRIESLWIRVYSADSGKPTSDWYKMSATENNVSNVLPSPTPEQGYDVTLKTKSGRSYIVAVANVNNLGVKKSDSSLTPQPLSSLLDAAQTWDDFLDIAVVSPTEYGKVDSPDVPLPMAGCFTKDYTPGSHSKLDWETLNFTPFTIPAQDGIVKESGAIHLLRLVSNIKFNFIPGVKGENKKDILEVTVNSYTIYNAPKYSWLYERGNSDEPENNSGANFGDAATDGNKGDFYADVPTFDNNFAPRDNEGISRFNFWLGENKHIGTSTTYTEREKRSEPNGPLFTSLTGNTWTPNNMATYIKVNCTVKYTGTLGVGEEGQIEENNPAHTVYRTGTTDYFIHLGYIEGANDAEKSKDFNCYRNTDYTYNVYVNGVDDIRVDAWAEQERYPGEEGMVSDLIYETVELDAHYHAFNIQLTDADLNDFGFIITSYYNNTRYEFTEADIYAEGDENAYLYNWIELRPTDKVDELAEYKPRTGDNSDGKTFRLIDLKNGMNDAWKSNEGLYTVFVNEYTYEPMYGEENYGNESTNSTNPHWLTYINQPPRSFYIRVTRSVSQEDGNSVYARSKYGVSQMSIQTYYSNQAEDITNNGTAIGVERENETLGLNTSRLGDYGTDASNGRFNAAQWVGQSNSKTLAVNGAETSRPLWSTFITQTSPLQIPAVNEDRAQGGPLLPDRTLDPNNPLETMLNVVKLPKPVPARTNRNAVYTDPQSDMQYSMDIYNACMNRNRDNNGNGRIDPEEIRWYIPAMGKYLRLVLGMSQLADPLVDFNSLGTLPKGGTSGWNGSSFATDFLSRYMFVTSDNARVLWPLEGTSTSTWEQLTGWTNNRSYPWQVRCIRNLGTDMRQVTEGEKVDMAYTYDLIDRFVEFNYYNIRALRNNPLKGNVSPTEAVAVGAMPIHNINSPYNVPYKKFEYSADGSEITVTTPGDNTPSITVFEAEFAKNPCSALNTSTGKDGWRVPNQKELAILANLKVLNKNGAYLSCTYSYFNMETGEDNTYTNGENRFMAFEMSDNGTTARGFMVKNYDIRYKDGNMAPAGNLTTYIRCVRDAE